MEIAGLVQGVGYRHYLREHATRLGIAGWARNLSSGNIEFTAQGTAAELDEFVSRAREGPDGAQIKQVITLASPASVDLPRPFTILR